MTSIDLDTLPEPPAEIAAMIESGKVTMEWGERQEREPAGYRGPLLLAETHYRIAYNYRSRSSWRLNGDDLRISVHYWAIDWRPSHRIWFRSQPPADGFWTNRLVLHEFDHVQISNDSRFAKEFERRLRRSTVLQRKVENPQSINQEQVDAMVRDYIKQTFDEISSLVAIRYKELDRVTKHGRQPLPIDSPLAKFLRPNSTGGDSSGE